MIGIIPAAGHSERMYGLPKFLLPVAGGFLLERLCSRMTDVGTANIDRILFGTLPTNCDLVGGILRRDFWQPYWVETETMNETVLAARQYAGDQDVLFGMPDTYWTDGYVYQRLAEVLNDEAGVIASVALWNTPSEYKVKRGMVETTADNRIIDVLDKPKGQSLTLGWGAIAWQTLFWRYIRPEDAHVGFALQRAIDDGKRVQGVVMDGKFWDCGTPDEYFDCIRQTTAQPEPA